MVEVLEGRTADVEGTPVSRVLPRRARRTVGAWCFVDHLGPVAGHRTLVGPHPHTGLHTVTWLISGELVHTDSLGSEQPIRPGQVNLMTAGEGISHAEIGALRHTGPTHAVQLWVAQPEQTRHGQPAFEHHGDLPQVELANGAATVIVGSVGSAVAPTRHDTALVGLDLDLRAGVSELALSNEYEHAIVVLSGAARVDDTVVRPGSLGYLGLGRDALTIETLENTRAMVIGGEPFEEELFMWWNFVLRSQDEATTAFEQWQHSDERFGVAASELARIAAPTPPWLRQD